jgi:hypothetical protein
MRSFALLVQLSAKARSPRVVRRKHIMSRRTAYEYSRALTLLILCAASFVLSSACGDDDSSGSGASASDGGIDDGGKAGTGGKGGGTKAGAGGTKAGTDGTKAGAGGTKAGTGGSEAGGEGGTSGGTGGTAGSKSDTSGSKAGTGGSNATRGATVTGVVVDISDGDAARNFDSTKYPVVPNVKVCVYENTSIPCATTDAEGKYSLQGLPESLDVYLSYEKDSFAPVLFKPVTGTGNELPAILVVTTTYRDSFAKAGGIDPDENAGLIFFRANLLEDRGTSFKQKFGTTELYYLKGYSVSLEPASKAGPVYVSAEWKADASLTKSSPAGWGIIQAAPGNYTAKYTHPVLTCPPTTTKVVKGYITTYVGVVCAVDAGDSDAGI